MYILLLNISTQVQVQNVNKKPSHDRQEEKTNWHFDIIGGAKEKQIELKAIPY